MPGKAKKGPRRPPEGGEPGLSVRACDALVSKMPGKAKNRPQEAPGGGQTGASITPGPGGATEAPAGAFFDAPEGGDLPHGRALQGRRPERPAQGQTTPQADKKPPPQRRNPQAAEAANKHFTTQSAAPNFAGGMENRARPPERSRGTRHGEARAPRGASPPPAGRGGGARGTEAKRPTPPKRRHSPLTWALCSGTG